MGTALIPYSSAWALLCMGCASDAGAPSTPAIGGGISAMVAAGGNLAQSSAGGNAMIGAGGALANGGVGPAPTSGAPSGGSVVTGSGGESSIGSGGGAAAGAPAIGAGGTTPGSGAAPNGGAPSMGTAGAAGAGSSSDACTRWQADRANLSEGTWSGNVTSCDAGDLSPDARANALRVLNLYRFLAGLPAVTDDPMRDAQDQQCALMMRANNMLSHSPPMTWTCWTQDGANAANGSNIGTSPAVASMDGYMLDPGNPTTLGHRRWVLSNSLGPVGIGGTDRSSCMMTIGGTGKAGKAWAAWPPPGSVPFQVISAAHFDTVDSTGWSLQSDTINLSMAQVTVTSDGAPLAVTVTQLLTGYGSRYAIRWNPMGWSTTAGKKYSVSVSGVTPAITYDVEMVDCK